MRRRVMVCRCKECGGITFMALYNTPEETMDANRSYRQLQRGSRNPQIEEVTKKFNGEWCLDRSHIQRKNSRLTT